MATNGGNGTGRGVRSRRSSRRCSSSGSSVSGSQERWIERNITKLECIRFAPASSASECQCGRTFAQHHAVDPSTAVGSMPGVGSSWSPETYTAEFPTDAYGVIEFASGPHPTRAHYMRVSANTEPELLLYVLTQVWRLRLPKLVLSVHGGLQNFELQPKLRQLALNGLLKAARTTDAWLISTGLDNGVARLVGEAIGEETRARQNRVAAIGIAPWGVVRDREQLIGCNKTCKYFAISSAGKALSVLNRYHNYFLLVDDGRCGAYGTETQLRRRLERHLCGLRLCKSHFGIGLDRVPVFAALIEGGANAFRHLLDLTLGRPPVPVVVCDGSGRAADILAFVHKHSDQVLDCSELYYQLSDLIADKFRLNRTEAATVIKELRVCLQGPSRQLIFVFRLGEGVFKDLDDAILTSLFSSQKLSRSNQLKLTMAWSRVDLARAHLFQYGQEWKSSDLERAMMEALMNNRIEFVRLFLEWGVNVAHFLSRLRLEELYSFCLYSEEARDNSGRYLKQLLKRTLTNFSARQNKRLSLYNVGRLLQELIGDGFTHEYTKRFSTAKAAVSPLVHAASASSAPDPAASNTITFANTIRNARSMFGLGAVSELQSDEQLHHQHQQQHQEADFRFPYTELMTWAVLCRRYELAWFFMQCGKDATAKALFSAALLRAITAKVDEDVQSDYHQELSSWAEKFETEALEMLEHCYRFDPRQSRRLVTYRLAEFGGHTCMSLAYASRSMRFLNHACPQIILNDLWYGGIRESSQLMELRVLLCCFILAVCPPAFFILLRARFLTFKTLAELRDQPQTRKEFAEFDHDSLSEASNCDSDDCGKNDEKSEDAEPAASTKDVSIQGIANPVMLSNSQADGLDRVESNCVQRLPHGEAGKSSEVLHYHVNDPSYLSYCSNPQHHDDIVGGGTSKQRPPPLPYGMCVSEFFSAPITRYWLHLMSYAFFIFAFLSYALVALPQTEILWQEVVVFAYILSYAVDKVREVAISGGRDIRTKLRVHLSDAWNVYDACICAVSMAGIGTRLCSLWHCRYGVAREFSFYGNYSQMLGKTNVAPDPVFVSQFNLFFCSQNIMVLALALWLLRVFEVLINWKHLGPYLYILADMMVRMLSPVLIMFIIMFSFGIVRQGIQYPSFTTFNITVLKGVFLKPYFIMYGEVYADEIDPDGWANLGGLMPLRCAVPITMVLFMLVDVILCISMIIAVFNELFRRVHAESKQLYKYLRFSIIIEYQSMPLFPPPFSAFSWTLLLFRWLRRRRAGDFIIGDDPHVITSLKLFLRPEEAESLQDFEEQCVQDLLLARSRGIRDQPEQRLLDTHRLVESSALRLEELTQRQAGMRHLLAAIDKRLAEALESVSIGHNHRHPGLEFYTTICDSIRLGGAGVAVPPLPMPQPAPEPSPSPPPPYSLPSLNSHLTGAEEELEERKAEAVYYNIV